MPTGLPKISVVDGTKVLQQKSLDCIKYILHGSINRPVWRPAKVSVAPTGNHTQKNRTVMDLEIIIVK